ncbi:MAG TPA: serine/threonine-protein kinase [Candidatus Limnocylindria bacterium]
MTTDSLILGRYRLDREIAVGGTARVWRARDVEQDRPVAVKLLHPHLLPDATSRRRLEGEARAAEALSHPAIAAVYDVSGPDDDPALIMELVDGQPLSKKLERDGPMAPKAAAALAADVAEALYHAHQRGIIHRDVKPANILVERRTGRARLIDFGIAHSLEAAAHDLTRTGTSLGTPRYMAPEQLAGDAIGPRTDLWGLGAVLYQALSGRVPFDGATPLAIAEQQRAGAPPLDADPALAAVVARCLSVAIDDRPVHAGAVAAALRNWIDGDDQPALAMEPGAPVLDVAETQPVPIVRPVMQPAPRAARRPASPLAVAAGVLVLVVALAGIGLAISGGLPAIGEADTSASPSPSVTPKLTPNWRPALLAAYQDACGEPLDRSELQGLSRTEAETLVAEAARDCQDEGNEGKGKGHGKGHGGPGHD